VIDREAIAQRMVIAHGVLMSQIGSRVTLTALAERMTRVHGTRRFTPGQVSDYQKAEVVTYPLEVIWTYAKASGVDPGWLAFGSESKAPAPAGSASHRGAELPPAPLEEMPRRRKATAKRKRG
jgi:hypothetical protein